MTFHPAAHPGIRGGVGGQGVGRLDSHLAHSLGGSGETARNIFRSSLNREERKEGKGRKEDEDYVLFFIQVTALEHLHWNCHAKEMACLILLRNGSERMCVCVRV